MKLGKIMICVLLVLCMTVSLCACTNGGGRINNKFRNISTKSSGGIVGEWVLEFNYGKALTEAYNVDADEAKNLKLPVYMTLKFDNNGKFSTSFNVDQDDADNFLADFIPYVYAYFKDNGISVGLFEAQEGCTIEEHWKNSLTEPFVESQMEGTYELNGTDLSLAVDGDEAGMLAVELDGDVMKITPELGGENVNEVLQYFESMDIELPLVLKRK